MLQQNLKWCNRKHPFPTFSYPSSRIAQPFSSNRSSIVYSTMSRASVMTNDGIEAPGTLKFSNQCVKNRLPGPVRT